MRHAFLLLVVAFSPAFGQLSQYAEGLRALGRKDFQTAIETFTRLIAAQPHFERVYYSTSNNRL